MDPRTLGINIYLLIGAAIVLATLAVVLLCGWIGLRMWLQSRCEQQGWEQYQQQRLGPDGRPYPPFIDGICKACGRGDHRIYHLPTGEELCPTCYEAFCRTQRQSPVG